MSVVCKKFSYVYVLVSAPEDTYYEQTLISAFTLRHYMPEAHIMVLTDERTADTLNGVRGQLASVVSEIKTIPMDAGFSNMIRSRWLKTSLYSFVSNDFLYIDADTLVTQPLDAIESMPISLGAVLDKHLYFDEHILKDYISRMAEHLDFEAAIGQRHFNSGILLCRKNQETEAFFQRWHERWLFSKSRGVNIDQVAFAQANYLGNGCVQELDGLWNCQLEYGTAYFFNAKILHMFVTGDQYHRRPHPCMDPMFFEKVKKEGLTEEFKTIALHPLAYFNNKTQLIGGVAVDYFNTEWSRLWNLMFCSSSFSRSIFNVFNFFARQILSLKKKKN